MLHCNLEVHDLKHKHCQSDLKQQKFVHPQKAHNATF